MLDPEELFRTGAITGQRADFFVGRFDLIRKAVNNLLTENRTCVIYGERGVGKTSLAWQIATTLSKSNPVFSPQLVQAYKLDVIDTICVFPKFALTPVSVTDLMAALLARSGDEHALFRKARWAYEDSEISVLLKDVFGITQDDFNKEILVSRVDLPDIFSLFCNEIEKRSKSRVVFFIDEAENIANKDNIGKMLKNMNFGKIVFIGIADTKDEIIGDHESSIRNLIDGDIEVEPMSGKSIKRIFDGAEEKSAGRLSLSHGFVQDCIRLSFGFPWIAQNLGYQATDASIKRSRSSGTVSVDSSYTQGAYAIVKRLYQEQENVELNFSVLSSQSTRHVAGIIAKAKRYLSEKEILKNMAKEIRPDYDTIVSRLREASLIVLRNDGRIRVSGPIVKSFLLDEIGKHSGD